ncbi:cytochrome P450 [Streptomyces viridochromogenes DSM 40736]|uniref:Cytochrome P450 n=1 Tax=Streptomyces viridochromogenes (strain DSM 40736 / JCM 4977 / BCRC 1201 / Tue 494) TaxID=591159 RepID=D9WZA8_STRVT|nr:cytochrome P450 [Streptomyces viridochromogenes DSM 40736]
MEIRTVTAINERQASRSAPTAPGSLPLLGHALRLARRPHQFLSTLSALGPVVRIKIGGYLGYVVTEPGLIRKAFVTHSDQGILAERTRPLTGEGVIVLQGQRHRQERRLIAPAFAKARIADYASVMARQGAECAQSWRDGQEILLNEEMHELAVRTMAATLFQGTLGAETAGHIHRLLPPVMTLLVRRGTRPAWTDRLPLPSNRRFEVMLAELKAVTRTIITSRRAELAADPEHDPGDLLGALLQARDDESGAMLSDTQVHDELLNFLVAGTQAAAATLAWIFHELSANPNVEAALHAELDAVLTNGRPAEFADLERLDVTKRVVTESLRKYSPWLTLRQITEPTTLGDVEIPGGVLLFACPIAVHRDPAFHPDPMRFDPDRWLPQNRARMSPDTYIPFGMGARQCPGNVFALTQITLQIATIAARWRFRTIPGSEVKEVAIGAFIQPTRMPMRAEARF